MTHIFQFKHLMLQLDPDDAEEDENNRALTNLGGNANPALNPNAPAAILTEADQVVLQNYKVSLMDLFLNCVPTMEVFFFS